MLRDILLLPLIGTSVTSELRSPTTTICYKRTVKHRKGRGTESESDKFGWAPAV